MSSRSFHILMTAALAGGMFGCRGAARHGADGASAESGMEDVATTCNILRDHLSRLGLDAREMTSESGCRLECAASLDSLHWEVDPLDILRDSLIENGWTEAIEYTADGAGTSSYRVVRDGRYCQVSGGAPAWIDDDDEIRQSNEYHLSVECVPTSADADEPGNQ